jgi:hypothetical protein
MDFARLNVDVAIRCNGCRYTRNMKAGGGGGCVRAGNARCSETAQMLQVRAQGS